MQRPHGCSAAIASANLAPQEGEPLTPAKCVDMMSTHENHQADTSQGILDAIPTGQAIIGTVADANASRNLGKYYRLAPDVPWRRPGAGHEWSDSRCFQHRWEPVSAADRIVLA
jgi:hypothetical protein